MTLNNCNIIRLFCFHLFAILMSLTCRLNHWANDWIRSQLTYFRCHIDVQLSCCSCSHWSPVRTAKRACCWGVRFLHLLKHWIEYKGIKGSPELSWAELPSLTEASTRGLVPICSKPPPNREQSEATRKEVEGQEHSHEMDAATTMQAGLQQQELVVKVLCLPGPLP